MIPGVIFTVDSASDAIDANPGDGICSDDAGNCTLRAAIMEANASSGADTIVVPSGTFHLSAHPVPTPTPTATPTPTPTPTATPTPSPTPVASTSAAPAAAPAPAPAPAAAPVPAAPAAPRPGAPREASELAITDDLTINGSGAGTTIIDGGGLGRVFHIPGASIVNISGVTVQGGNLEGVGGGILNSGTLTLTGIAIISNRASRGGGIFNNGEATLTVMGSTVGDNSAGAGGGIASAGTLVLADSTISNNSGSGGGGIYNYTTVRLTRSTVSGNSATLGGGVVNAGTLTVDNSSISGNRASRSGGGIWNMEASTLALTDSTVNGNSAGDGGGIMTEGSADIQLAGTIIANSLRGGDCSGLITSLGYNLDSDGTCRLTEPTDLPKKDPLLGPLQDNGGPTFTHALLPGSPAYQAGDGSAAQSADQRGVARPQCGVSDIGAYEIERTDNCVAVALGQTLHPQKDTPVAITLAGSDADTGDTLSFIVTSLPASGSLSVGGSEIVTTPHVLKGVVATYTPGTGFTGTDRFGFKVNDGVADSAAATVTVNVLASPTVTKAEDSDDGICDTDCSLREAIAAASPNDTVAIPAGTYLLGLGSELSIDKSLTLVGAGSADTVIRAAFSSGEASSRVFNITGEEVAISGVAIENGNATNTGNRGGGILNSGTVVLTDVVVRGNRGGGEGGGIYNGGGLLTLIDSNLLGNTALHGDGGGGIYNDGGTVTLTNSTIDNNSAAAKGGGILNSGTLTMRNGTVNGNTAGVSGGGIHHEGGRLTLIDSTVSGNLATTDFNSTGGGIFNAATLTLTNTEVSDNTGDLASGIYNVGTLTLTGSTVSGSVGRVGGYVNRCVNDIRRRPSQPLSQRRSHPRIERRDRRLRSTQGPSDA